MTGAAKRPAELKALRDAIIDGRCPILIDADEAAAALDVSMRWMEGPAHARMSLTARARYRQENGIQKVEDFCGLPSEAFSGNQQLAGSSDRELVLEGSGL